MTACRSPSSLPSNRRSRKVGAVPADFRAGQGQHADGFDPARQAVGNPGQRHDVGGAGQQETAGAIVFVHAPLDCQQQVRGTLNLVDDGPVQAADEAVRVGQRGIEDRAVVQCDIGPAFLRHLAGERGLARPARSYDRWER